MVNKDTATYCGEAYIHALLTEFVRVMHRNLNIVGNVQLLFCEGKIQ